MENILEQRVGDIVIKLPKANDLFKTHRIDFCCGGHKPLKEAIREANADEAAVIQGLQEITAEQLNNAGDRDWQTEKYSVLIDHIISTHHAYMQKVLPELSELTNKILRVHGPGHDYLVEVHKQLHLLKMDIEQHLVKEEQILFPLIKHYEENQTRNLLEQLLVIKTQMEKEHEDAGEILRKLRVATEDYTLPADACKTFARTYELLEEMESDLFEHIHKENNILFRRLELELEGK